jgi:predicted transcriptional regulator
MVRISVDLPEEVAEALARAAAEMQSTREALLVEAARDFLATADGFDAFMADRPAFEHWIAEAEADVAAGRVIPAEEVFAELDAIIEAAKARKQE